MRGNCAAEGRNDRVTSGSVPAETPTCVGRKVRGAKLGEVVALVRRAPTRRYGARMAGERVPDPTNEGVNGVRACGSVPLVRGKVRVGSRGRHARARHTSCPRARMEQVGCAEHGKAGDGAWTTPARTKQISCLTPAEK